MHELRTHVRIWRGAHKRRLGLQMRRKRELGQTRVRPAAVACVPAPRAVAAAEHRRELRIVRLRRERRRALRRRRQRGPEAGHPRAIHDRVRLRGEVCVRVAREPVETHPARVRVEAHARRVDARGRHPRAAVVARAHARGADAEVRRERRAAREVVLPGHHVIHAEPLLALILVPQLRCPDAGCRCAAHRSRWAWPRGRWEAVPHQLRLGHRGRGGAVVVRRRTYAHMRRDVGRCDGWGEFRRRILRGVG